MKKSNNTDGLAQLKEQIQLALDFMDEISEINPDYEFSLGSNDIYISYVRQAFDEVMEIIRRIEKNEKPMYQKRAFDKILKEEKKYRDGY